jgi:hypothetical protein
MIVIVVSFTHMIEVAPAIVAVDLLVVVASR